MSSVLCLLLLTVFHYVSLVDESTLSSLAREKGFAVRDVPRDGNCLFSAVAMTLENLGVQLGDRNLREELVEHLQSHPYTRDGSTHLRDYLSAPVAGDDPFNADTEAPSEQDEYIKGAIARKRQVFEKMAQKSKTAFHWLKIRHWNALAHCARSYSRADA